MEKDKLEEDHHKLPFYFQQLSKVKTDDFSELKLILNQKFIEDEVNNNSYLQVMVDHSYFYNYVKTKME